MNTGTILKTLLFSALVWHLAAAPAPAAVPPKEPMLRIERRREADADHRQAPHHRGLSAGVEEVAET